MGAMTHDRFNFRTMVITAVARVVGAANKCLPLTATCATTVRIDSILFALAPSFVTQSPPGWTILDGLQPPERSTALREAERGVKKTRFAMASRRWRWGPRCWPHAWLP